MVKREDFLTPPAPRTRLGEPRFDEEATSLYAEALDILVGSGLEFLVGGALAMNQHTGIWRETKDLDVYVRPHDVDRALRVFEDAGYVTERIYRSWLSKVWKGDLFVDVLHRNASGVHPPDDLWFERAGKGDVLGREVPVVPAEELIFTKLFVGNRYRYDGADVLHLLFAKKGDLDWKLLLRRAGTEYAGLLLSHLVLYRWAYPGFASYVPDAVVEELLARSREDADHPTTQFRGRLLDLNAFEVDVMGWDLPDAHAERMRAILGPGVKDGGP